MAYNPEDKFVFITDLCLMPSCVDIADKGKTYSEEMLQKVISIIVPEFTRTSEQKGAALALDCNGGIVGVSFHLVNGNPHLIFFPEPSMIAWGTLTSLLVDTALKLLARPENALLYLDSEYEELRIMAKAVCGGGA